jgi:hypothetical protein
MVLGRTPYPVTPRLPGNTGRTNGLIPQDQVRSAPRIDAYSNLPDLKTIRIDLTANVANQTIAIAGNFFWVYSASDTTVNAQVVFGYDTAQSQALTIRAGFQLKGVPFGQIVVTATAQTPAGRYLEIMYGTITDFNAFSTENSAFVFNEILTKSPPIIATYADSSVAATTQVLLLAQNLARVEAIIRNNSAFTIRVGDVNTGAARGTPIDPNTTLILTTSDNVYVYNTGAGSASVSASETRNS